MTIRGIVRHVAPNAGQQRQVVDPTKIVPASELMPWKVTDISIRPFVGYWCMNPSIHFDGELWRCVIRCADYAMPNGVMIRGEHAVPTHAQTKNVMVIFDPKTWKPKKIWPMLELDGLPRVPTCASRGFEDMRLFRTDRGGLQGIAASLHLDRNVRPGGSHAPEQVILSFDDRYNVIKAKPIRGTWSGMPQKNWVPFDGIKEPRFLYSIDRGVIYDDTKQVSAVLPPAQPFNPHPDNRGGTEVRVMRRVMPVNASRTQPLGYGGIRGGSQLVRFGNGSKSAWLGIGHEMRFANRKKLYWHTFYVVDSDGKMLAKSAPMKLVNNGIEFAAGMVIDGDRVVISFGVDDAECRIGETRLSAVLDVLKPVESPV
jgi:hypothetical protein